MQKTSFDPETGALHLEADPAAMVTVSEDPLHHRYRKWNDRFGSWNYDIRRGDFKIATNEPFGLVFATRAGDLPVNPPPIPEHGCSIVIQSQPKNGWSGVELYDAPVLGYYQERLVPRECGVNAMNLKLGFSVSIRRMKPKAHWEAIYSTKRTDEVSWFAPHLAISLELVRLAAHDKNARILDVGGGVSTLVDDLIDDGYTMSRYWTFPVRLSKKRNRGWALELKKPHGLRPTF